jgi:hypothetical protein
MKWFLGANAASSNLQRQTAAMDRCNDFLSGTRRCSLMAEKPEPGG